MLKSVLEIRPNKVIKFLIYSDVALIAGLGFISPIFAVFLTDNIKNGSIEIAGFAAAIYWIVESIVVIPAGWYLDKNHGEKDDLWFIIIGNFLAALALIGYIYSSNAWQIYVLQALYAFGMGMNIPGYNAIFTRHIDKGQEASEWGIRSSLIGFCTGVAGAIGGLMVNKFGFNALFAGSSAFVVLSSIFPIFIRKQMSPRNVPIKKVMETKVIQPPTVKDD